MDMSKTFERVNVCLVLEKLCLKYVSIHTLRLLEFALARAFISVKYANASSSRVR